MSAGVGAPAWLSDAVDAVLADLQHPTPIPFETAYRPRPGEEGEWLVAVRLADEPGATEFEVVGEHRGAFLWEYCADQIQTWLQETHAGWGQARPPCPGHTHPARPYGDDEAETAWWYCPETERNIAPIGRYH